MAQHSYHDTIRYALIAGFVEPGEAIEEAVHREVSEEVGIRIKNLKYMKSQSWPFPNSLMLAFTAEYESQQSMNQVTLKLTAMKSSGQNGLKKMKS